MAYRFLLEVPSSLAAAASVVVESVGDAQVILIREPHGLGIDEPDVDITVAAHSLHVVDAVYNWFDSLGASRSDIRLVLHSGERLTLEATDRGTMVAAIRRDQPWVERTLPKVGEHEIDAVFLGDAAEGALVAAEAERRAAKTSAIAVAVPTMERQVTFRHLNYVGVQVNDLVRAERFYRDFLNMEVVMRVRNANGAVEVLADDLGADAVVVTGKEPVTSVVRNGPVTLALQHAGRGARLERGLIERLAVTVDTTTFANLKGEALVRPLTILASNDTSFTFLDPFGVIWEISVTGDHIWPPV